MTRCNFNSLLQQIYFAIITKEGENLNNLDEMTR